MEVIQSKGYPLLEQADVNTKIRLDFEFPRLNWD